MASADDEIRRRRERGRRSQAAYRERQAEATRSMIDQNERFNQEIKKLVYATHGDERPDLLNAIRSLAETAGIDTENLGRLDTPQSISDEDLVLKDPQDPSLYETEDGSRSLSSNSTPPQRIIGNVWLDPLHYVRVSLPPDDILPYLGQGSKTFAGLLFWSIMSHFQSGCKQPHAEPSVIIEKSLAHSETMADITAPFIVSMVEARLEYRKNGSISAKNAAAGEADLGTVLHGQVSREYQAKGQDPNLWLTCNSIEVHVRRMFGEYAFGLLEDALAGQGKPSLQDLMSGIICQLYDSGVCFGDGPRWNIDVVDRIFLERIGEVLAFAL